MTPTVNLLLLALLPLHHVYFERELAARDADGQALLHSARTALNHLLPPRANTKALAAKTYVKASQESEGVLEITLWFKNEANHYQPYPRIQLTLTDASFQPVVVRQLDPPDYLAPGIDVERGMAPGAEVRTQMKMNDPEKSAVGYEFEFL